MPFSYYRLAAHTIRRMDNFCFTDVGQTLKTLKTSKEGLSGQEAQSRLKSYGKNELEKGKRTGIVKLFFSQFKDFMTLLLIVAAARSEERRVGKECRL